MQKFNLDLIFPILHLHPIAPLLYDDFLVFTPFEFADEFDGEGDVVRTRTGLSYFSDLLGEKRYSGYVST